jgi:adenine-specific DNA methylase
MCSLPGFDEWQDFGDDLQRGLALAVKLRDGASKRWNEQVTVRSAQEGARVAVVRANPDVIAVDVPYEDGVVVRAG